MLDHGGGGLVAQLVDQLPGGVGVVEVQVRQRHATVLDDVVPPAAGAGAAVAGPLLVRVLAVAQVLRPVEGEVDRRGQ